MANRTPRTAQTTTTARTATGTAPAESSLIGQRRKVRAKGYVHRTESAGTTPSASRPAGPRRAAVYLRQSLDMTGEGLAVDRQRKDCRKLAADRGWVVVDEYNDNDKSASGRRKRPGFEQMLADARAGKFDVIVGWHLDRLTRTIKDLMPLMELAERYGVAVTTVAGDIDLTTDMGQTVAGLLAVVANGEIKRKGARQTRANQQRAEAGMPSIGGAPTLGYGPDKVSVDEPAARKLRDAYANLLAGRAISAIARDLNASGYLTTRGGPWSRTAVVDLLVNPRNAGLREYKGEIMGRAAWPAIVDEGTFRAAQAILSDPARRTNTLVGGTRRWLGTGLYVCGLCGEQSIGSSYREKTKDGDKVRTYFCTGPIKHLSRRADIVDEYVLKRLFVRLARKDAARLLVDHDAPDVARLTRERDKIAQRLEALAVEFAQDDTMTPAMLRAATKTLKARLAQVQDQMTHHSRTSVLADIVGAEDRWARWNSYDIDRQRAVLAATMRVTLHRTRPGGNSRITRRALPDGAVTIEFLA